MKRVTQADIDEMRAKGYDHALLNHENEAMQLGRRTDMLVSRIEEAFQGVTLGDGIGLQQAQGIDDYEDDETCAAYRRGDEKDDWKAIPTNELNRCNSSLSFFDAEGMRFHLPAYMIAELLGEYHFGMSFSLTYRGSHTDAQFSLLSQSQRTVVREFLELLYDDPEYEFDRAEIERSLRGRWAMNYKAQQGIAPNP